MGVYGIVSRNVEKIIKGKLYFKDELEKRLSEELCEKIWNKVHERLTSIFQEYQDLPKGVAAHTDSFIFPAAAIYLSIKEYAPECAFEVMQIVMNAKAQKAGNSFAKMAKIPGFKGFFLKMWDKMSHKLFGENAGFKNVFYPVEKNSFKMDITFCPYNTYLTKLDCPELTILFCRNDEYSYGNIPGLKFTRKKTIGGGADLCDFKMERI